MLVLVGGTQLCFDGPQFVITYFWVNA